MNLTVRYYALLLFILGGLTVQAQTDFFGPVGAAQLRVAAPANFPTEKYKLYQLKTSALRTYLAKAPLEFSGKGTPLPLTVPLPDGTTESFALFESPILAPAVAAANPGIKTYTGVGLAHPGYTLRLSLTSSGFDALILGVDNDAVYYTKTSTDAADQVYATYFARDVKKADAAKPFGMMGKCGSLDKGVDTFETPRSTGQARQASAMNNTGTALRTFRLAVATTGEFTQRKGNGNVNNAFNAVVAYVNRMNAVYRVELSVAFVLVTGTNTVYPNPTTDPYTNGDDIKMLDENQANLTSVVGNANYDVGHVFGASGGSGGGIASKGAVCDADQKGKGVSGVGDGSFAAVFDDQLISHEVGHQFDMSHTFNSSIPVCTTREPTTSVEPGSGATIMSYGFTCSNNTGGNDDYEANIYQPFLNFHTVSYEQAATFINRISCFTTTPLTNSVPVINSFPTNTTIPKSTPFALTGTATDANSGDLLTYSWEGTDIGTMVPDQTTFTNTTQPPFFRSYPPVTNGTRFFPRLDAILNGTNITRGDKLPSVGIATNLRLTVRDNAGGVTYRALTVTVDGNSGPFLETTNLSGTYPGNSTQTITWDVANTTAPPVNCAAVTIMLSTDGGLTFPTTLLANTPNDGSEPVTLPALTTSSARIKIVSSNNIFFDISNRNFSIVAPENQPPVAPVLASQAGTVDSPFSYEVPAFTDPESQTLAYAATGLPASLTFNPATRTISGRPTTVSSSTVTITATDPASATASASFTLTINPPVPVPLLVSLNVSARTALPNGTISTTALVSGGRPPYTYNFTTTGGASISTLGNVGTYSELTEGVYNLSVSVIDATLPNSQTVTDVVTVTITAAPAPVPVVKVDSNDPAAAEGSPRTAGRISSLQPKAASTLQFETPEEDPGFIRFQRNDPRGTLVINYTIGGTATNGVDFNSLPTSVTFLDGQTEVIEELDPKEDEEEEEDETVIITLIDEPGYDPDPSALATTLTIKDAPKPTLPPAPSSLTITSFSCNSAGSVLSSVNFVVGYPNGATTPALPPIFINGVTGNGQLGQRYTFTGFDNNTNSLTIQDQASRSTYFVWNFRQACGTAVTPPVPPTVPPAPSSLTITSFSCNSAGSVLSSVNFVVGYPNGATTPVLPPIFINGVTGNGQLGQRYTFTGFDNNTNSLTIQDQASRSTYFVWNFRQACGTAVTPPVPPTVPPAPSSLTITSFSCNSAGSVLSSVNFVVGYPNGATTPALPPIFINGVTGNGQLGQRYTFTGFDNNTNSLTIQDQASRSTYFVWNFRQACAGIGARSGAESAASWQLTVLGNPSSTEIVLLLTGAQGESINLNLTDATGRTLSSRRIEPQSAQHREVFSIVTQPAGVLILQAVGNTRSQRVKVLKQ